MQHVDYTDTKLKCSCMFMSNVLTASTCIMHSYGNTCTNKYTNECIYKSRLFEITSNGCYL